LETTVTQRWIEIVVGRLVTDEDFRRKFLDNPHRALSDLLDRGSHLTPSEIAALVSVDGELWKQVAGEIDPRLQKPSLEAQ
jgi:hypothetical protein